MYNLQYVTNAITHKGEIFKDLSKFLHHIIYFHPYQ